MKTIIGAIALTVLASAASATSIERAGGIKVEGESTWVSAVTVCETNRSDCFKITTETEARGRALEAGEGFGPVVVAPRGSFSISNPYSVADYVQAQFGASHVEIIMSNGEDDKDHW